MRFPLTVRWTSAGKALTRSVEDREAALRLFDEIRAHAKAQPTMVEYSDDSEGGCIAIGAGRAETVVTAQRSADPPYFMSRGKVRGQDEEVFFLYAGENTPYPGFSAITLADGKQALFEFLDSGALSSAVQWERL